MVGALEKVEGPLMTPKPNILIHLNGNCFLGGFLCLLQGWGNRMNIGMEAARSDVGDEEQGTKQKTEERREGKGMSARKVYISIVHKSELRNRTLKPNTLFLLNRD
jgi:hypothetical protein